MMTATRIKLTKAQAEWVSWALDPMVDFWCNESGAHDRDGEVLPESDLPQLDGLELTLSENDEVNSDLLYRMEVQAVGMAEENGEYSQAKAAERVAGKMRAASPAIAAMKHGGGWID